jgi:hypothetical protein
MTQYEGVTHGHILRLCRTTVGSDLLLKLVVTMYSVHGYYRLPLTAVYMGTWTDANDV